jgi:hypothetical protein
VHQKGDTEQAAYWGPTVVEQPINITAIWLFLPGVCVCSDTHVCTEGMNRKINLNVLDATVQNCVATATRRQGSVRPCQ